MTTLIKTALPDGSRTGEILELVRACCLHDHTFLSFPLEEDMICLLAYRESRLCAALSLLPFDEDLWECRAFTLPEFRRQGLFSKLLDEGFGLLKQTEGADPRLCFPADPGCADTMAVLTGLEAEFWYSEHMMKRELTGDLTLDRPADPNLTLDFCRLLEAEAYTCTARTDGRMIGSCTLYPHGSSVYLCEVLIPEPLRRQGWGTRFMEKFLTVLAGKQVPSVTLQVSGDNAAALALYKKTGFQITETLSYYLC